MRMSDYFAYVAALPKKEAAIAKNGNIVVDCGNGPTPLSALCRGLHTIDTKYGRENMVDFNLAAIGGRMIRKKRTERWRARWVRDNLVRLLNIK